MYIVVNGGFKFKISFDDILKKLGTFGTPLPFFYTYVFVYFLLCI